jgi:hypothetical protein
MSKGFEHEFTGKKSSFSLVNGNLLFWILLLLDVELKMMV